MNKKYLAAVMAGMMLTGIPKMPAMAETETSETSDVNYDFVISDTIMNLNPGDRDILSVDTSSDERIAWSSSDASVVTVDSNGSIMAVGNGHAVVTAKTKGGLHAECDVYVTTPVSSVVMNNSSMTLSRGAAQQLSARVYPDSATNKSLEWSSDAADVVSVDANGMIHALKTGEATITARASSGEEASILVTVVTPPEGVSLSASHLDFVLDRYGDETTPDITLYASIAPSDADDTDLTWKSSSQTVASVSNGTVRPLSAGTAVISATTSNGKTASCTVTVRNKSYAVKSVKLTKNTGTGYVRSTDKLSVSSYEPEYAENATVTWSSSNPAVASVDGAGNVIFRHKGTAVITARAPSGASDSCTYTVKIRHAQQISMKRRSTVRRGESARYSAFLSPADVSYLKASWKTSNRKIATIDSHGVLTAKRKGTVTVTVWAKHDPKVRATKTVTIRQIDLKKAAAKRKTVTMKQGTSRMISSNVRFTPSNTTEKAIRWKSSNKKVAAVSGDTVTALSKGKTTLTGTTYTVKTVKTKKKGKTVRTQKKVKTVIKYTVKVK